MNAKEREDFWRLRSFSDRLDRLLQDIEEWTPNSKWFRISGACQEHLATAKDVIMDLERDLLIRAKK